MNKIFKVVWSKSKECYVVVSEFAKNNSGKKKIVVAGIFAALAMTNANVALAVNEVPTSTGGASVAFGDSATVTGANAIGLGNSASVTGVNAVALGTNVKATTSDAVVIGTAAKAESAGGGIAIGQNAYSKARYSNTPSVAVGKNSIANGGTAVAIGTSATVNEAGASYSQGIAIGGGALPGQGAAAIGDQSIAIGGNTKAFGHSSIVIGGDDADRMTSTKAVYTDITTGEPAVATVSDAVKALTGYEIKWRDYNNATADHIGITVGTKGQSGNAGIAIGTGADSKNRIAGSLTGINTSAADNDSVTNAIAIGTGAKANRDNSVALGGGSTTDKPGTKQTSYTLPSGVVASWEGGKDTLPGDIVSFGAEGFERQLKNVAPGEVSATSTDAINGSQLAAIADQLSHKYVSIKSDVVPNKDNKGAKADESIAIGPNASTDKAATSSVAIGDGASATVTNGVAIGSKSVASTAAGVAGYNANTGRTDTYANLTGATLTSTLGGVAVGTTDQTRQINYVAAGTADTDAVNVAQLKSVNLAFTGDTGSGDVNLANSKLAVNGDNTYIETTANGKKITIAGKKQDITVTNGVATATPGMADAKNVADAINQAVANSSSSWNLSANGEATTETIEKGNTVDFSGDDNITVARNNKNISVALKKDLSKLNSASFNNAAGNPTVKIDGDKGINAGDMKVTNVADGVAAKDAVNVSQLKKTDDKAEANKAAIARKISLDGNTGSTTEKSLSTGDVKFKIKGEDGITTAAAGDDVTVKLDTDTKNKIDNAADKNLSNLNPAGEQKVKDLAAWNVVANSETAEKVKGGDTVKFIDGDNVEITQAGKNFTISTKKDVTFDNVTANQAITAPKVKATTGVETPQVTGLTNTDWVPGQTQPVSGRAATEDQLKKVDDQVAANKDNITKNAGDIATNKADIAKNKDNIDKNTTAIARKISLGGNTGSTDEKSLSTGDVKFNVKGDNGLTTVANGDDVTVKLDDATKDKIDNAANKDLSNLTPAGEQQVKDLAAWNVVANGETAEKVQGGDTVKFINGDNIEITQAGKNFTIATKKDVTFDTVTANDTITAPKVKATTGVETPEVTGLTNKTWVPGQTQPVSGRAATEDQLKAVDDQVADNKDKIGKNADNIADNKKAIDKNAADIATNKDNIAANKDNITKNAGDIATNKADIAKNKDNIDKNTTAIARKISLGGDTGSTDEKSLSTGDVKFNVKGENGLTTVANGDDVTVKLDDATKDKIDNAANKDLSNLTPAGEQQVKDLAAWNVVANDGTAEKVQGGDTVKFINGDNIEITQNGKDFTVATKKDVTFDTVTANDTITAPKVKATTGVETPEVTGLTNKTWVPGQTQPVSGRAATEDQLKAVDDQVAANKDNITKNAGDIKTNKDNIDKNTTAIARKISLGGDTGSTDEKSLSTGDVKFNIKGQNGIVTEANGEDVTVKLDDATANKINNAANTDLSNLTDAGKQQVKDLSAWNVVANNGTAEKVEGGNTVKFIDGDNISITQNGKDFTVATKKDVTFDTVTANDTITAPKVKATDGVETPEVTGLTNKTWVPGQTQPVSGRAATEDQLKAVDDQVAANKDNITKNAGDIATNKANIAANKAQIDKNTEAISRKISLGGNTGSTDEKSLSTGDVKFNIKGENGLTTVANGEDVTVKIDDATKAKIDNAANQDLSNLTDAGKQQVKDLSAWNVTAAGGTVEKVQGGDTVKFQAGDNLEVKQDKTTFTYSLAKDLKGLNSVTVGDENGPSTKITPAGTTVKDAAGNSTTVNGAGMTITPANAAASPVSLTVNGLNNGGNQIHGVAPGTADTDAVNVSQLKQTKAGLQQAINNVGAETQRVGAHAAAMAALKPIQYDPLEPTQIMAGIGNYRGETAGAIGLAHYRTEDTMFNVGITLGSSHSMVNAGVTHKFGGSRDRKDAVPERYKAGPISSIYVMQDEVSHLRNQNEEYKSKLEQQQSEIDALKAAVNQLLANKA
ncbi:ESPR-type extended signal peptide-containing protein [Veillonella rogosae]|uniref:ESPR-type extended signal peptide-containing protein n=1 Tax=Veillonella rogosae TaxID=423477 RepID=A0AA46X5P3_9FIRM|nr:ESPR-type extended signal peptide-containing protein [Veillonella rogosae]UZG51469.1 ESPR-type extended signal peptide-containing protein [Veillonella rogosae]